MKRRVYSSHSLWAALLLALAACAPMAKECPVAADQKSSFMAAASDYPLNVIGDDSWSIEEREALQRAMAKWNVASRETRSDDAFKVRFQAVKRISSDKNIQGCELDEGSSEEFLIHRAEGGGQWQKLGFSDSTPAVTLRCHRGEQLTKQAILVNPSLIHRDQMMSVFLHELGHAIGLDHSCQLDGSSSSYRGCMGLEQRHSYVLAVMYPTLKVKSPASRAVFSMFSGVETKESLGTNDLLRAGCVFGR